MAAKLTLHEFELLPATSGSWSRGLCSSGRGRAGGRPSSSPLFILLSPNSPKPLKVHSSTLLTRFRPEPQGRLGREEVVSGHLEPTAAGVRLQTGVGLRDSASSLPSGLQTVSPRNSHFAPSGASEWDVRVNGKWTLCNYVTCVCRMVYSFLCRREMCAVWRAGAGLLESGC